MTDGSLLAIEGAIHLAMSQWQEAETPEELLAAETALQAAMEAEVRKVDGVRSYLKFCDTMIAAAAEEVKVQSARGQAWKARKDRLKAFVQNVMESEGLKRLEGRHGCLMLKGNGGKQAVTVTDESLVPDDMCMVTVRMQATLWNRLMVSVAAFTDLHDDTFDALVANVKREPSLSLIGAALEKGDGVPGAYLAERGVHVECK